MENIIFEDVELALPPLLDSITLKNPSLQNAMLVAIGRESVLSAQQIAKKLKIPMEFLFTELLYSPLNPECSIAVVSEDMEIIMNEDLVYAFNISLDYVYGEAQRKYDEVILPMRYQFRKGEGLSSFKDKDVILMDLGIETGLRAGVAVKTCMNLMAKSVSIASPIMPKSVFESLNEICDEIYCPYVCESYVSSAHYFPNLREITHEEFSEIITHNITIKG